MTSALILSTIADEPRVRDVDLATELGMARPTNIRMFIERNREELETFGPCIHRVHAHPTVPGREITEFWLNRNQALLTCILSRTDKGRSIRAEVIRRFNTYEGLVGGSVQLRPPLRTRHVPQGLVIWTVPKQALIVPHKWSIDIGAEL